MKKDYIYIIVLFVISLLFLLLFPSKDYVMTGKLYVSEVLAKNTFTLLDDDNDYSDYIEIYNGYNYSINLENYHLSDNEYDTNKWTFPNLIINPNEYLIVYASGKNKCNENICHTNFKLSSDGEVITLSDNLGNIINKFSFNSVSNDISYGLVNKKYAYLSTPTPGMKNISTIYESKNVKDYTLIISEYMTHNKSSVYAFDGGYYDFVEIYNYGSNDINLINVYLSDNKNKLNKYHFPDITIKAKDYIVVYLTGEKVLSNGLYADFGLNDNDTIFLSVNNKIIDEVKIKYLPDNVSYGRIDKSWYYFYKPTPGKENNTKAFKKIGDSNG